jgi:hypothetical protein
MEEMRNDYKIFVRDHEGKRPRGRPKRMWENNIRVNLKRNILGRY